MGKISIVSAKYIIHSTIEIKGAVDKPDVIGAIFGQTEGLLGSDLELRELQRSGRIGRIEVKLETKGGITRGAIIIPSSLDKAETSIVGAALEIIERIGPCESKIRVERIEDVRISKRDFVLSRAKQLLKKLSEEVLPDSQELAEEVAESVRVLEIQEFGRERLPAGPAINESEEIIVVEGRADVLNLLKHGMKNAIAMNGTSVPQTVRDLSRRKVVTAFVDGDRGGDLILKELVEVADVDFITQAPSGKEVEELSKKEIFQALRVRKKISSDDKQKDTKNGTSSKDMGKETKENEPSGVKENPVREQLREKPAPPREIKGDARELRDESRPRKKELIVKAAVKPIATSGNPKDVYRTYLENLIGSRAAIVLDNRMQIVGKVPLKEISTTLKNVKNAHAVVLDGDVDQDLVNAAEKCKVECLIGMGSKVKGKTAVEILTVDDF